MFVRGYLVVVGLLAFCVACGNPSVAQERTEPPADTTARPDSVRQRAEPAPAPAEDQATQSPDSLSAADDRSTAPGRGTGSGDENAVAFSSTDSLVIRTGTETGDRATLYKESEVSYQEAKLRARTIEIQFQSGTMEAMGAPSDTAATGRPIFEQGSDQSFTGEVLSYNLSTKRGRVVAARTKKKQGFIEGEAVKMYEDSTLFVEDGSYTTCDCPPGVTPSYSLRSDQMKVQDRWVYTGPIQLFLFNVPTPLWLPFGFLPNVQGRRSGPLPPEYGEDRRGFYLKNWGWYFALNPYMDLKLQAGIWSQGSYEFRPQFRYRKRYRYNGNLDLTYRREKIGEEQDPNFRKSQEGQLRWSHNQNLSPTASLNGDVNLVTSSDFAQRNSSSYDDAVQQDISSSINYRKRWPSGGRQFNVSARQKQQFQSGRVRVTLPNLSFSQNSFKPFRQEQRIGDERWFEKITTSYEVDVTNTYNFDPRDPAQLRQRGDSTLADSLERADISWYDALFNREKYKFATGDDQLYDFQASHRIPLNMSFRVDRYNLSLTPSVNYTEDWYISTLRRTAQRDTTNVLQRRDAGFYARRNFSTSFSSSSQIYGTFPVQLGPFEGLRHRLSPSLSANYQPNFNAPFWGRTRVLRYEDGTPVIDSTTGDVRRYDILSGSRVRSSTKQWRLSFSLNNVFETKRVTVDSTGTEQTSKITLLNLDLRGLSYNFAADSFRVGDNISLDARTRVQPFNISMQTSFSPYALRKGPSVQGRTTYRRIDRLMVAQSPLTPARLTRFQASLSANFSGGGHSGGAGSGFGRGITRRSGARQTSGLGGSRPSAQAGGQLGGPSNGRRSTGQRGSAPNTLSEFNLPWSLGLNFNYRFRKPGKEIVNRSATLGVDFSLNVTPLWRVQGNTGYDFLQKEMSTTRISINRNLGCWNMSFNWVPFGRFQKYGFSLQVSSGQLSQLLQLQIPNKGGEGRLGGFGQQLQNTASGFGTGRRGAGTGFR